MQGKSELSRLPVISTQSSKYTGLAVEDNERGESEFGYEL